MLRISVTRLTANDILEFPGGAASFSDMVLGFIEEPAAATHAFPADSMTSGSDEEEEDQAASVEENKAFWDEQHQLLQVINYFHLNLLIVCLNYTWTMLLLIIN